VTIDIEEFAHKIELTGGIVPLTVTICANLALKQ
jgi:hypothetical protein